VVHGHSRLFSFGGLRRADRLLDAHETPRLLLLQWVPHGYGYHSMNVWLCLWLLKRHWLDGDRVEIMVHEPYLSFAGSLRQRLAALAHRLMTILLIGASERIWVSAPRWEAKWRRYTLGRDVQFRWMPIGSSIEVAGDAGTSRAIRDRFAPGTARLVGSFTGKAASCQDERVRRLEAALPHIIGADETVSFLLIGEGSTAVCRELRARHPAFAARVHALGVANEEMISSALSACDVVLQLYPDGATARHSTLIAALSHGCPTVTNLGMNSEEFWAESEALVLVPEHDGAAVARAVTSMLDDPDQRSRLAAGAARLYRSRFRIESSVAALRTAERGRSMRSGLHPST
jgi:glycosyltransferase involved in cell wall biosynthesis